MPDQGKRQQQAQHKARARADVITLPAHRIAYAALPKAGCTSVKQALAGIDPRVDLRALDISDVTTWHRLYPTARYHAPSWRRVADHWRFCVVRDPARRLISCYTDIVVKRGALRNSPRLRASGLPLMPDPDTFFQLLDGYRQQSSLVRNHVLGAHVYLGPDLAGFDRVYRTSDLAWLGDDLTERSGQTVTLPHSNPSARATRLRLETLQDATLDLLRPFLDQEYAFLAGLYANPLGPRRHDACAIPAARVS